MPKLRNCYQSQTDLVKRFGSESTFTEVCNGFMKQVVFKGSEECFFGNYPTLSGINAAYHKNMAVSVLMSQLNDLSEYCGCKDKIRDEQAKQCAEIITMTYPYLKISELALFFARFKAAKYGHFYGAVDPLVITSALREFMRERSNAYFKREAEENIKRIEEGRKSCISWEEYCKRKWIKKANPLDYSMNQR